MLCDGIPGSGKGLDPPVGNFLLHKLLKKVWIALCMRPIALAV